jgi:hypothetical protein
MILVFKLCIPHNSRFVKKRPACTDLMYYAEINSKNTTLYYLRILLLNSVRNQAV